MVDLKIPDILTCMSNESRDYFLYSYKIKSLILIKSNIYHYETY